MLKVIVVTYQAQALTLFSQWIYLKEKHEHQDLDYFF